MEIEDAEDIRTPLAATTKAQDVVVIKRTLITTLRKKETAIITANQNTGYGNVGR